ncbi:MAG TPA: hypothetical protein VK607_19330 [Kofleriaceae bacterium]|nr:hypothetical protein [Kofleriaceae bacterium]
MKSLILSALIATVPAAIPAAAHAQPVHANVQVRIGHERYDRFADSHWARDTQRRWRMVGGYMNARNDRQFINVGGPRVSKLRIEAVRGEPAIDRMTILFGDGSSQTVELDGRLQVGAGEVIDLEGAGPRQVRRVIVFTQPNTRGVYSLYAG